MVKPIPKPTAKAKPAPMFYVILIAIFLGGAGVLGYLATRGKPPTVTTVDANLPPLQAEGYLEGSPDAPVVLVEFGDFECPQCGKFATVTEPDVRKYLIDSGKVSLRYFDYPLAMHPNTWEASHTAACANEQGRFWPMHDMLYNGQLEWNGQATGNPKSIFKGYAQQLGLDVAKWESCYDTRKFQRQLDAGKAEGDRRRVNGTPTFYIGNRMLTGNATYDELRREVDAAMAAATAAKAAAPKAPASKAPPARKPA